MNWFVKCVQHISCRRSFHFIFWICKNSIRTCASIQFTRAFACAYIESNVTPSFVCASQESWFPLFTSHTFLAWGHPSHCRNRWVLTLMPVDYSGDGNSNTVLMHWKSEKLQFFSKQIGTGSCVCVRSKGKCVLRSTDARLVEAIHVRRMVVLLSLLPPSFVEELKITKSAKRANTE